MAHALRLRIDKLQDDHCCWILGRLKEAEEKGDPVGGLVVSINLNPQDLSNTGPPYVLEAAYSSWYEASNTYTVQDFQVWVRSEMMHLTP